MPVRLSLPEDELPCGVSYLRQHLVSENYREHTHDFYELFFMVRGKAVHCVNGETQLLSEGDFALIRPSDAHKYEFLDNFHFELISVGFVADIFESTADYLGIDRSRLLSGNLPPLVSLNGSTRADVLRKLQRMEYKPVSNERTFYFRSILPYLLYRIISEEPTQATLPDGFTKLISKMNEPENYIAGLPRLLELCGVSQEHITRQFRKYTGMSPSEFINLKRLSYAAQLLSDGGWKIIDICYTCGFNNLSHFYRCFKKQYGCAPKQFALERKIL